MKYTKSFVSIIPLEIASKCSPMDRYVNKAAIKPAPQSSAMNSNKNWNQIRRANVTKKATIVLDVREEANIPMLI